jgi:hypothetical protein
MIVAICRRLDGIPLAIELAAARAAVLGVEEVATHLDDRFRILTGGRPTALPRHQTLRATLDWSYELLSEPERVILRRLAVFAGVFRLDAASAVIASPEIAPADVLDGLANLVAKSLVTLVTGGTIARYRLLDTMRAYALAKLIEAGERQSRTNDLTSLLACSDGLVRFSKRIGGRVSAAWEVETKALDGEDQPNGLQVKATCRQNRRTKARCAIVALASYARTGLAEMPRPSHHRCWTRRVGGVSPTPLRRFPRVPWLA